MLQAKPLAQRCCQPCLCADEPNVQNIYARGSWILLSRLGSLAAPTTQIEQTSLFPAFSNELLTTAFQNATS